VGSAEQRKNWSGVRVGPSTQRLVTGSDMICSSGSGVTALMVTTSAEGLVANRSRFSLPFFMTVNSSGCRSRETVIDV
jgi:hypothetical protein